MSAMAIVGKEGGELSPAEAEDAEVLRWNVAVLCDEDEVESGWTVTVSFFSSFFSSRVSSLFTLCCFLRWAVRLSFLLHV